MTEYEMPIRYGWICPRCGQANAPWMSVCTCSEQNNVSYSDRTDYKADELLDVLNSQDLAEWLDKQDEYTPASIVEHALKTLPTVDAIPVEWMENRKCKPDEAYAIRKMLDEWAERKEE